MLGLGFALTALVLLTLFPSVSSAQTWKVWDWLPEKKLEGPYVCGVGVPISEACQKEFEDWLLAEEKWRRLYVVWANYPMYDGFRTPLRNNIKRPVMPWWIRSRCIPELDMGLSVKTPICEEYEKAIRYDWVAHIEGPSSNITFTNKVTTKTSEGNRILEFILKNLHFDPVLTNSSNDRRIFGFFGTHVTIAHTGRLYYWAGPGIIFILYPGGRLEARITYGLDVYIIDIPMPFGDNVGLPLYLTVAKAMNKRDAAAVRRGINSGLDMIGISITLK